MSDVSSLKELALIEAIFKDPNNWIVKRSLECTSKETYNKMNELTLLLIRYLYSLNQNIMNRIQGYNFMAAEDALIVAINKYTFNPILIRILEEVINYRTLKEPTRYHIWGIYKLSSQKIINKIPFKERFLCDECGEDKYRENCYCSDSDSEGESIYDFCDLADICELCSDNNLVKCIHI